LRQKAAIRLIFFGDGKDKKDKPKGIILFQTVSKLQPDEDKVVEIKQEKLFEFGLSVFDTITFENRHF
jgi:hypothetical protein